MFSKVLLERYTHIIIYHHIHTAANRPRFPLILATCPVIQEITSFVHRSYSPSITYFRHVLQRNTMPPGILQLNKPFKVQLAGVHMCIYHVVPPHPPLFTWHLEPGFGHQGIFTNGQRYVKFWCEWKYPCRSCIKAHQIEYQKSNVILNSVLRTASNLFADWFWYSISHLGADKPW